MVGRWDARPVDRIDHHALGMALQRLEAQEQGVCLKCSQPVPDPNDAEYGISALCDDCYTALFADEEDCE